MEPDLTHKFCKCKTIKSVPNGQVFAIPFLWCPKRIDDTKTKARLTRTNTKMNVIYYMNDCHSHMDVTKPKRVSYTILLNIFSHKMRTWLATICRTNTNMSDLIVSELWCEWHSLGSFQWKLNRMSGRRHMNNGIATTQGD